MTEALTLLLYLSSFCLVLALAGWTADKVCKIVERMNAGIKRHPGAGGN